MGFRYKGVLYRPYAIDVTQLPFAVAAMTVPIACLFTFTLCGFIYVVVVVVVVVIMSRAAFLAAVREVGGIREALSMWFRPTIITRSCEKTRNMSTRRRALWLTRINRQGMHLKKAVVCNLHFVSG